MGCMQHFAPVDYFACVIAHTGKCVVDILYVLKHKQTHKIGMFDGSVYRVSKLCKKYEIP